MDNKSRTDYWFQAYNNAETHSQWGKKPVFLDCEFQLNFPQFDQMLWGLLGFSQLPN